MILFKPLNQFTFPMIYNILIQLMKFLQNNRLFETLYKIHSSIVSKTALADFI